MTKETTELNSSSYVVGRSDALNKIMSFLEEQGVFDDDSGPTTQTEGD